MKNVILNVAIIFFTCFISASYAASSDTASSDASSTAHANENQLLHVYVTNLTRDTLIFDRVIISRTGSHFSVDPKTINPGESTVVTVEKLVNNDVEGRVIFLNTKGDEASLYILDQQQFHSGQPIFSVSGNTYSSNLLSKTPNPRLVRDI